MKKRFDLQRVSPESVGVSSKTVTNFIKALEDWDIGEKHSLMMVRNGKVFGEAWWTPYGPGIPHIDWSESKTYTATAIGIAITQGLLSLDSKIIDIFPEYAPENPSENLQKLSVRHLLSMSVGMEDMSDEGPGWLEKFINTPVDYEPGTVFMYNSQGTNTLAAIIHKVTGMTMDEYLKKNLYDKLGMSENIFWTYIPGGIEWGAGGIYTTIEDNIRLGLLYLNDGQWNGEEILSKEYAKEAKSKVISSDPCRWPFGVIDDHPETRCGYGYKIWQGSKYNSFRFYGAQGQFTIGFPDHDMVVAVHLTTPAGDDEKTVIKIIYDELIAHIDPNVSKLEENPEDFKEMDHILKTRALERPEYKPYSPIKEEINGKSFDVDGDLTFLMSFEPREFMNTGIKVSTGISEFTINFTSRKCTMDYIENGKDYRVEIGLDGRRLENKIQVSRQVEFQGEVDEYGQVATEALMSGFWQDDNTFIVRVRWIETSNEKSVKFQFKDGKIYTDGKLTTGALGVYQGDPEISTCIPR